ncbi:MAG: UMP kinase [Patescibacteria group bacterium]|nr:UMP kinase [Patescibacteria group bacterium]
MRKFNQTIVISVGGSLICPESIDVDFLKDFKKVILDYIKEDNRVILVAGGGKICRKYNEAVKQLEDNLLAEQLDAMGIRATKLNAELVRLAFGELAYNKILDAPDEKVISDKQVIVAGGWKPGASSDNMAVNLAKFFGAKKVINLSNIDYVYDKNPKEFKDAKPIPKMTWPEFFQLVGEDWKPGMNAPFDPIASKLAQELKLEVAVLNGKNTNNLMSYLKEEKFIGTIIS